MLSEDERKRRESEATEAVGHRLRVVWQEPEWPPEWPEVEPGWGVACRVPVGDAVPGFAAFVSEEEEGDDGAWSRAARVLRMAITWQQAEARGEDPEAACASL